MRNTWQYVITTIDLKKFGFTGRCILSIVIPSVAMQPQRSRRSTIQTACAFCLCLALSHLLFLARQLDLVGSSRTNLSSSLTIHSLRESSRPPPQKSKHQPVLYWHVGPPKTATTLLQCALCANSDFTDPLLLLDNLVYIGTCPYQACGLHQMPTQFLTHRFYDWFPDLNRSFDQIGPVPIATPPVNGSDRRFYDDDEHQSLPPISSELIQRLEHARNLNQSAILIYEGAHRFDGPHLAALARLLEEQHWQVQVVVAYRRLYDWLPSKYNSIAKLLTYDDWPTAESRSNSELISASFDLDNRGSFSLLVEQIEKRRQHPAETVLRNYQQRFSSVSLLDLHDIYFLAGSDDANHSLLQYWFCRVMMPTAPSVCEASPHIPLLGNSNNPSVNLDYDILAVAAYESGRLPATANRLATARDMEAWMLRRGGQAGVRKIEYSPGTAVFLAASSSYDPLMPRQCLSVDKLERLRRLSETLDRKLFLWTEERRQDHDASFQRAVDRGKFCSINVTAALDLDFWKAFFKKQQNRK
jgi:hypothetical protein